MKYKKNYKAFTKTISGFTATVFAIGNNDSMKLIAVDGEHTTPPTFLLKSHTFINYVSEASFSSDTQCHVYGMTRTLKRQIEAYRKENPIAK